MDDSFVISLTICFQYYSCKSKIKHCCLPVNESLFDCLTCWPFEQLTTEWLSVWPERGRQRVAWRDWQMDRQTNRQTDRQTSVCICQPGLSSACLSVWLVYCATNINWCTLTDYPTDCLITDWLTTWSVHISISTVCLPFCVRLFTTCRFTGSTVSNQVSNCLVDSIYMYIYSTVTLWQLLETPNTLTGFFILEVNITKAVSIGNDFRSSYLCLSHCALWLPRPTCNVQ